jgi:hypothetical protein
MTISVSFPAIWILFSLTINLANCGFELDFRVTPAIVQPLETTNVTLQCLVNFNKPENFTRRDKVFRGGRLTQSIQTPGPPTTVTIAMIRILKNFQEKRRPIAEISYTAPQTVHKLDEGINFANGAINSDNTQVTSISITWEVASSDVYGAYRCDAVSFDDNQNAVLTTSSEILLGKSLNALDLLRVLNHKLGAVNGKIEQQEKGQRSGQVIAEQLKSSVHALERLTVNKVKELEGNTAEQSQKVNSKMDIIERRINYMERQITKRLEDISVNVNFSIESAFFMLWPRGSYGLLQPESGCPISGITNWESGWVKHHTESTDRNEDTVSTETHLQKPTLEREGGNNFITQHFCIKNEARTLGRQWPKGSYCVNKKDKCPTNFQDGYIKWDEENDGIIHLYNGSLPRGIFIDVKKITIEYCCRQDGSADAPIHLPNLDPFYLYRYGGKCQQVHDTTLTEEFLLFDTENTNNSDEFGRIHPDGRIKNIRLELCHYAKQ